MSDSEDEPALGEYNEGDEEERGEEEGEEEEDAVCTLFLWLSTIVVVLYNLYHRSVHKLVLVRLDLELE